MTNNSHSPFKTPLTTLILAVMVVLLLLQLRNTKKAANSAIPPVAKRLSDNAATTVNMVVTNRLYADEYNNISIYRRVSPSVVSVANKALVRSIGWFGSRLYEVPQGAGSGFVWDRKGRIISNYHVVHEADSISVTFADGTTYDAKIIGVAPDYDLAVIEIDAPEEQLHPVDMGSSRNLQVGQSVLAIGNPFGLDTTLTVGIVSALGRSITSMTQSKIHDVIQTDAAINPGNSGGPLLDSSGRLIGINTAIISPSGAYAGVGFAVPADTVARIVPQLIERGRVRRVGFGVQFLPDQVTHESGVKGVALYEVFPGTPASKAGLKGVERTGRGALTFGDVIVAVDKTPVNEIEDLRAVLELRQPGEKVKLIVWRDGSHRQLELSLIELP